MLRRDFLRSVLAGAAGAPVLAKAGPAKKRASGRGPLPWARPADLFTPIVMEPGQRIEFPMEPGTQGSFFDYKLNIPRGNHGGYLIVPTFEVVGEDDSSIGAINDYKLKLFTLKAQLLFVTAKNNSSWPAASVQDHYARACRHFRSKNGTGLAVFTWLGHLVVVDTRTDQLVMPIRVEPFVVHPDSIALNPNSEGMFSLHTKGKFICFAELGLAVLDNRVVVCGRLS